MLGSCDLVTLIGTARAAEARAFYEGTLGLRVVADDPFAIVCDANGVQLRISKMEQLTPQPFAVLGWAVSDIEQTVDALAARGVAFERYEGMQQDARGIWTVPGAMARVAWFKDPDGNTLSLTEAPA